MQTWLFLHILGITLWSASALGLSAFLAAHVRKPLEAQPRLSALESRLFNWITLPSMAIASICGYAILAGPSQHELQFGWMQAKLGLVLLLFVLTMLLGKRIQDLEFEPGLAPRGRHVALFGMIALCVAAILYAVFVARAK